MNGTRPLNETVAQVLIKKAKNAPSACAVVAINSMGHIVVEYSGRVFPTASCTSTSLTSSVLPTTIPLLSQHTVYRDALVAAGLTRYPITPRHAVIACLEVDELMSLPLPAISKVMYIVRQISATLIFGSSTHRCSMLSSLYMASVRIGRQSHTKKNTTTAFLATSPQSVGQNGRRFP